MAAERKNAVTKQSRLAARQREPRTRLRLGRAGLCALLFLSACSSREEQVADVQELLHQGRFAETVAPLRELLEDAPADPKLNRLYGESLLRTGQAGSAVWPLRKAAESPDYAVEAGLLLVRAQLESGSDTDAVEAANRVLHLDPDNRDALVLRAQARLEAMQEEEALEDLDRLLEDSPDDLTSRLRRMIALLRLRRIEAVETELAEIARRLSSGESAGPELLANLCVVKATFEHERGKTESAEVLWKGCLENYPVDPTVVGAAVNFYSETRQASRVTEVLRAALKQEPGQHSFREALASRLRSMGQAKEAEALLVEGAKEYPSPGAFGALADHYSEVGDIQAARRSLEQAFELMEEIPEIILFGYGDVLIQAGDYTGATRIIEDLDLPIYQHLLLGRLRLAQDDPAGALEELEAGIRLWPNSAAARQLAGRAAEQVGDFTKAASHYREAVREGSAEAAVALAELHVARGQHSTALEILRSALAKLPYERTIWLTLVRTAAAARQEDAVRRGLQTLAGLWGGAPLASAETMRIAQVAAGPVAALQWLQSHPVDLNDPENAPVLRAFVDAKLALGEPAEALKQLETAIEAHPEESKFQELRGRTLIAAGSLETAEVAFRRSLELDPESSAALHGQAVIAAQRGQRDQAVELYDRAARSDPTDPEPGWAAFQLLASDRGDLKNAALAGRLERYLRDHPHRAAAALALAELRVESGDREGALEMAQRAISFGSGSRGVEMVARIQLEMGDPSAAIETLKRMAKVNLEQPSAQYWLGKALASAGDRAGAQEALRRALEGEPFPEAAQARAELARLGRDAGSSF